MRVAAAVEGAGTGLDCAAREPPGRSAAAVERVQARVRSALELVHDPAVDVYKNARAAPLGTIARHELHRRCTALLRHCWRLVGDAYGPFGGEDPCGEGPRDGFYSVHRPGDPRNCLALAAHEAQARQVVQWWPGPAMVVSHVPADAEAPEAWIAMAVAMLWRRPAWL